MISLYDARNFRSPFLTWNSDDRWPLYGDKLASAGPGGRTGESLLDAIIFSPDSQRIAQISAHPHIPHVIIDAMKGDVKMVIPTVGKEIMTGTTEEFGFFFSHEIVFLCSTLFTCHFFSSLYRRDHIRKQRIADDLRSSCQRWLCIQP